MIFFFVFRGRPVPRPDRSGPGSLDGWNRCRLGNQIQMEVAIGTARTHRRSLSDTYGVARFREIRKLSEEGVSHCGWICNCFSICIAAGSW